MRQAASRSKSKQSVAAKQVEKTALGAEIAVADGRLRLSCECKWHVYCILEGRTAGLLRACTIF